MLKQANNASILFAAQTFRLASAFILLYAVLAIVLLLVNFAAFDHVASVIVPVDLS